MPTLDDFSRLTDAPLQNWLGTLLVSAIALAFAFAVHWLGARVVRRLARPYPYASVFVRYVNPPARMVLAVLALEFVWWQAPDTLHFISTLRELCAFALIAAMTWLSVRCAAAIGEAIIAAHPLDIADNLQARRIHTQARVLARTVMVVIIIFGLGAALMTFPNVRQIGASLLASAGVAGLVAGIAARPVLGNLIAGLQIAISQPIRLDDVVVIQGEWGRIEEITGTYVSVRIWDQRRLIVPLQWFIENPFTNWTRSSSQIIGSVFLWLDYRTPLAPLREELARIVERAPEWDKRVQVLQVTDANERAMQLRVLVSSQDSGLNWDLRCRVREGLFDFINAHFPQYLPRARAEVSADVESGMEVPTGELPAFTRRGSRAGASAASSTAANTEADPVADSGSRTAEEPTPSR
ncbi:mechanosensitive ion channel family protein [Paraburkholderia bannensis]|uniref:Small-conductance mechanosensitive channel n=1 Tax=Paraburkholderia tropica TaxID=92647 RepID=A0AAQ1JUR2_9BURK|nr:MULTISPECIES: mechanosensitive ion channel domain-containing protein [Paraburkholderia]RQM48477.1 mechanosensitive ion channel family protein [Paraburkholderia bannensis]RQN36592.1 mechanosensitive ion channel family protein [Paraburkholderia tropica]SEJ83461.1 Small-conductance mechanosensitive channel [Paraburkholderia tropica]